MNLRDRDQLTRALNLVLSDLKPTRYEADSHTARSLVQALTTRDWHSRDGIQNHLRGVTADALDDQGRQEEAALLRSEHPIVVTSEGRVVPRKGSDGAHTAFANAYKQQLLDSNFDANLNPLRATHKVSDFHPDLDEELNKRAARFLHENHASVRDFSHFKPEHLAAAYANSHNALGVDEIPDHPALASLGQKQVDQMAQRADDDGELWLKVKGRKIVKGTRPEGLR